MADVLLVLAVGLCLVSTGINLHAAWRYRQLVRQYHQYVAALERAVQERQDG